MPTHRNVPENTVALPAFRHLVEALELALSATQSTAASDRLLRPFRLLEADRRFWGDRLVKLDRELTEEPDRLRRSYEVRAHRIEPVGLVYLWPTIG